MLNDTEFHQLTQQFPILASSNPKQVETLRDQLKPSEAVLVIVSIETKGSPGLACLTTSDLYLVWTTKLLWVLKLPTMQTFHRQHLTFQRAANSFQLKAADEDGQFSTTSQQAEELEKLLAGGMATP